MSKCLLVFFEALNFLCKKCTVLATVRDLLDSQVPPLRHEIINSEKTVKLQRFNGFDMTN